MSIVDDEYPEIIQNLKRVTCVDCHTVDFIDPTNGDGWEFVGYDDEAELHRCPTCVFMQVDR